MTVLKDKRAWNAAWKGKRCAVCSKPAIHGHHIVYVQHLRREHAPMWDARNCLPLCLKCHGDHHAATRRVPVALLPAAAHEFAREYGFDFYLNRYYAKDPHHGRAA